MAMLTGNDTEIGPVWPVSPDSAAMISAVPTDVRRSLRRGRVKLVRVHREQFTLTFVGSSWRKGRRRETETEELGCYVNMDGFPVSIWRVIFCVQYEWPLFAFINTNNLFS